MTGWDWDAQRADTEETVAHLAAENGIPDGLPINLDIQTVAGEAPERGAYVLALRAAGHPVEIYTSDDGVETIEIAITDVPFGADEIWRHERAVTEIALTCQWRPDGWGFWEPDD